MRKLFIFILILLISNLSACTTNTNVRSNINSSDALTTTKTISLIPTYDGIGFTQRPAYEGILTVRSPENESCLAGGYYREAASSLDKWIGIEATIILPDFLPDVSRLNLENSSVHFIAHSTVTNKVGLIMSDEVGGYQPFWLNNADYLINPNETYEIYYPGDKLRVSLYSPQTNHLQFTIELLTVTKNDKYTNKRNSVNLPYIYKSPIFALAGFGVDNTKFKRVVSLEQIDSSTPVPTNAKIIDANYEDVYLYRLINGDVYKLHLAEGKAHFLSCPNSDVIEIRYNWYKGGENVSILPGFK